MIDWDPGQYARFEAQRERPALDLLAHAFADFTATDAWDLGCGPGNWTALIAKRYPRAVVRGLDASEAMLAEARPKSAKVEWIEGDIADWTPQTPPDFVFSNAALHLIPNHAALFPRIVGRVAEGGVFACQMPVTDRASGWRAALAEAVADGPWAEALSAVAPSETHSPESYWDWLNPLCEEVDIWTTTYLHALEGDDPIVEWVKGSSIRPYLQRLDDPAQRDAFLNAVRASFSGLHPRRSDGITLFPFQRLFILARR